MVDGLTGGVHVIDTLSAKSGVRAVFPFVVVASGLWVSQPQIRSVEALGALAVVILAALQTIVEGEVKGRSAGCALNVS